MNDVAIIGATRELIRLTLILGAGPLGAALIVGLLVALGQTMTQMNDPTVGLIARLLAVTVAVLVLLPWMLSRWLSYATTALGGFPSLL